MFYLSLLLCVWQAIGGLGTSSSEAAASGGYFSGPAPSAPPRHGKSVVPVPVYSPPPSPVYSSSSSIPIPVPVYHGGIPPPSSPQQTVTVVVPVPVSPPPRVPIGVPAFEGITPAGVPGYPSNVIPVPIWTDVPPSPPANVIPIVVPVPQSNVPIWTDPSPPPAYVPPSPFSTWAPPSPFNTWTAPTPYSGAYPYTPTPFSTWTNPTPPPSYSTWIAPTLPWIAPTPYPTYAPAPTPLPTPVIVPVPIWHDPTPEPTVMGPLPAPTTQAVAPSPRVRRTPAPTYAKPPANSNYPLLYSVTPGSVCDTVQRNLRISGRGFLSVVANYSCNIVPSCEDNPNWQDANGNNCAAYVGMICDADATANCRVACKAQCPHVACQDRDAFFEQCLSYKQQGQCVTNPNYMMLQCPVSCGFCGMFPAFAVNDTLLVCQAPPLGGVGSVTLGVIMNQNLLLGEFSLQSYACSNETSDVPATNIRDLAAIVTRPIQGTFKPTDTAMVMQIYVENIGLLDLSGPVNLFMQAGAPSTNRRLMAANVQQVWCAPQLPIGGVVSCGITRYISAQEQSSKQLQTTVWADAVFQGQAVLSPQFTFTSYQTTATPQPTTSALHASQGTSAGTTPAQCNWTQHASCIPWWAWLILALLILLVLACCCLVFACCWKKQKETSKTDTKGYVYRRPRPQASPPVAHPPSPPPIPVPPQEVADGPEPEARVGYSTIPLGPQDGTGTMEPPAVRLVFNTNSGPFEVAGPRPSDAEGPSHFVFDDRASDNNLSHSPTAGARRMSYSQHRRETPGHVVFNNES